MVGLVTETENVSTRTGEKRNYGTKEFEDEHDAYLSVAGLNLLLVTAAVVVFTHLGMVLAGQSEFDSSYRTLTDIMEGPLLLIVIAGLTGLGLVMGHLGVPEKLYFALYVPFGIIVLGTGAWSFMSSASSVNRSSISGVGRILDLDPESISWLVVAGIVLVASVLQWRGGEYRLDAMKATSVSTGVFVATVIMFAFGLSSLFVAILQTANRLTTAGVGGKREKGEPYFALSYALGTIGVMVLAVSALKFVDAALHLFGGHWDTIFPAPTGIGASKAILETKRAFQVCVMTTVFLTSALVWRRRNGLLPEGEPVPAASAMRAWGEIAVVFVVLPLAALASEVFKEYIQGGHPVVYDVVRAVLFAGVVVFVGVGYVPWNFITLLLVACAAVFVGIRYVGMSFAYDKPAAALICVAMFVFGKLSFRGSDMYRRVTDSPDSALSLSLSEWGMWAGSLLVPAVLLLATSVASDAVTPRYTSDTQPLYSYGSTLFKVYASFVFFYSMTLTFVDTSGDMPLSDSPFYDTVPENEPASLAIDGLVLFAVLMVVTSLWRAIIPADRYTGATKRIVAYSMAGLASVYMYINIRHDRYLSSFARKSQLRTEGWYVNAMKDGLWTTPAAPTTAAAAGGQQDDEETPVI